MAHQHSTTNPFGIHPLGIVVVCLLGCGFQTVQAQTEGHRIGLGVGALQNFAKDDLAAPVRYVGRGAPLFLEYAGRSLKARHRAAFSFSQTGFAANALNRQDGAAFGRADYILFQVEYAYARALWKSPESGFALWLGPAWQTLGHIREYFYTPENSEISWEVIASIGASFAGEYYLSSGAFELDVHIPIVAYINRPPYAVEGDEVFYALFERSEFFKLGRIAALNRFDAFSMTLSYSHRFSKALGAGVGYRVQAYRYSEPLTTAAVLRELRLAMAVYL